MNRELLLPERREVPARALLMSVAALAVPVVMSFSMPDWTSSDRGMLVWLATLIPAFLLSYYRGLEGVSFALAGGMAVITATQVSIALFEIQRPDFGLLLTIVGIYLAVSVGIAALAELLRRERAAAEQLALVDRLTGLPNRRHAELALESAFAAAERGTPLAVVMFDLDRFKSVNDKYGHSAGDDALRRFANLLATNTRGEDLSARFGGEEFISVLQRATKQVGEQFALRVQAAMRNEEFSWGTQTVSAGVAAHEPGMGTFEILVAAADHALYDAKESGRDRVVVTPDEFPPEHDRRRLSPSDVSRIRLEAEGQATLHLMVVEDDGDLRRVIARALGRVGGFTVWDTGNPLEAVEHFRAAEPRPPVVLTDIVMPELNGITMMYRIESIDPQVRAVYMSAYQQSKIDWPGAPGAVVAFLEKPVELKQLIDTLRAVATTDREDELAS